MKEEILRLKFGNGNKTRKIKVKQVGKHLFSHMLLSFLLPARGKIVVHKRVVAGVPLTPRVHADHIVHLVLLSYTTP